MRAGQETGGCRGSILGTGEPGLPCHVTGRKVRLDYLIQSTSHQRTQQYLPDNLAITGCFLKRHLGSWTRVVRGPDMTATATTSITLVIKALREGRGESCVKNVGTALGLRYNPHSAGSRVFKLVEARQALSLTEMFWWLPLSSPGYNRPGDFSQ